MVLLDLQDMEDEDTQSGAPGGHSGSSKGCGNTSSVSLLLCL
jgi:hypothetical protein